MEKQITFVLVIPSIMFKLMSNKERKLCAPEQYISVLYYFTSYDDQGHLFPLCSKLINSLDINGLVDTQCVRHS